MISAGESDFRAFSLKFPDMISDDEVVIVGKRQKDIKEHCSEKLRKMQMVKKNVLTNQLNFGRN